LHSLFGNVPALDLCAPYLTGRKMAEPFGPTACRGLVYRTESDMLCPRETIRKIFVLGMFVTKMTLQLLY
jgi:hypothetical protein